MIKLIIKVGISAIFLGGVLFLAIMGGLPELTADIREYITYVPIELRIGIYLLFGGLVVAFAKSFFD